MINPISSHDPAQAQPRASAAKPPAPQTRAPESQDTYTPSSNRATDVDHDGDKH